MPGSKIGVSRPAAIRWKFSVLISVIIPNHNYGDYIRDAIDSALRQTYAQKEIIVVDDGSTDQSRRIIESYGDQIRTIFKDRGGQCSAVNAGFALSRGEIIGILDADDYYFDDALAVLCDPLVRNPSFVKSQGYLRILDCNGNFAGGRIPARSDPSGDYRDLTLKWGPVVFRHAYTSGNLWARWYFECVAPLPESVVLHGADGYLNTLAPLYGEMCVTDHAVAAYRIHGSNIGPASSTFDRESLERRVSQAERDCRYLADRVRMFGYPAPSDEWSWYSWHHCLRVYSLSLMRNTYRTIRPSDLVTSPFRTYHTGLFKRIALTTLFGFMGLLPKSAALGIARLALDSRKSRFSSS